MRLSDIIEAWKLDTVIDDLNIDAESTKISKLHAKYIEWLSNERGTLRGMQIRRNHLIKDLRDYYLGLTTEEKLAEMGRTPFAERVLKNEVSTFIESDQLMLDLNSRMSAQEEKVEVLIEIMKSINQRNFHLSNATNWRRLMLGG